jgi:hypothetical protein
LLWAGMTATDENSYIIFERNVAAQLRNWGMHWGKVRPSSIVSYLGPRRHPRTCSRATRAWEDAPDVSAGDPCHVVNVCSSESVAEVRLSYECENFGGHVR